MFLYPGTVSAGVPDSYITELVDAVYDSSGTLQSPVSMVGYVEVTVPNDQDVLQYLRLNLSSLQDTDLLSTVSYRDVAASPNSGDRTRLYVNTSLGGSSLQYDISGSVAPVIYIDMDYANQAGGNDLFSGGTNYFAFNVTMNCTHSLSDVNMNIRFARNTRVQNDSMSVYSVTTSSGAAQRMDSDGDGFYDTVHWSGDLQAGNDVAVDFMGQTTPGANFNENFMSVDLDQGTTSSAVYSSSGTFTGISFTDRFSRGPIREGIELFTLTNWMVRGFIKNLATDLDYRLNGWEIYQIGQSTPLDSGTLNVFPFTNGQTEYTDWYDTGISASNDQSGYYSTAWDWEVGWGPSSYISSSTGTVVLPVIYEIGSWLDESVIVNSDEVAGVSLSVQGLARHIGYSGLGVSSVSINSVLPRTSLGGATNTWSPTGIRVIFINGSGQYDITSQASISSHDSGSGNGFVNVQINNVSSVIGKYLEQNEDIRLEYGVSGGSHADTQTYRFCQTSTLTTVSGTPVTDNACQDVVLAGVGGTVQPGGGGTGGGTVQPSLYADIVRRVGEGYLIADNLVNVKAEYDIVDTGTRGVKDIKAAIYVPKHGSLDESSVSLRIFSSSSGTWEVWSPGSEFIIRDDGLTQIGDDEYEEFLISKATSVGLVEDTIDLFNGDRIEIGYNATIPTGTSFIITRVFGYNYYEDMYMFEDMYVPIRREGVVQDLDIDEGEWQSERALVGTPVKWIKSIIITNPNNVSVEHSVSFDVFGDTVSANLVRDELGGRKEQLILKGGKSAHVDFIVSMMPGETKNFALEVTTPPVLETGRTVDVIESSDKEIIFMVNMTIENFGLEGYPIAYMVFNSAEDKIMRVTEGNKALNWSSHGESQSEIILGEVGPGRKRTISVVYREVPPILVTSMSSLMYGCGSEANMNILVIPSEKETNAYLETEVIGPQPLAKTVGAQLIEMRDVYPWEEENIPVGIDIGSLPDGNYVIYTTFKKDFQTLLSDRLDFSVSCPERTAISVSWIVFLAASVVIIVFLVIRSWKRKEDDGVESLKKKLRELD